LSLSLTCTLGPASENAEMIIKLLDHADRFRLNASHLTPASLKHWLNKLQDIFNKKSKSIPVVIDLQGAKMRIGEYPSNSRIPEDISIKLVETSANPSIIPVNSIELFNNVKSGEILSLNDNRIELEVTYKAENVLEARVIKNGPLSSAKGINRRQHPIPYHEVSENDKGMIAIANTYTFTEYAFSFTHDGKEAILLQEYTTKRLLQKSSVRNLWTSCKQLINILMKSGSAGATWEPRPDWKILGKRQQQLEEQLSVLGKPVILAGQVLEYMTHFPEPTRAEVVALYKAAKNGFSGIVLSDETAIGKYPVEAAALLDSLTPDK